MSCRTCSNSASCCLFSFWKKVNLFFILFVVSSLIQFLNASSLSFSFSINKSCCLCASRNLLSKPRIFSRHSVPSSPFFASFCQLCTSVRTCTCKNCKITLAGKDGFAKLFLDGTEFSKPPSALNCRVSGSWPVARSR